MLTDEDISPAQQLTWFRSLHDDPTVRYFVYEQNAKSAGLLYFTEITPGSCKIGYYLGEEAVWPGSGLILQIAALDFCFEHLHVAKAIAEVLDFNLSPQRIHKLFGLRHEGTRVGALIRHGAWRDLHTYSLTAHDWLKNRARVIHALPVQVQEAARRIVFH